MIYHYDYSDDQAQHLMLAGALFYHFQSVCNLSTEMQFTPKYNNAHAFLGKDIGVTSFMENNNFMYVRVGNDITEEDLAALSRGDIRHFFSSEYVQQAHFQWAEGKPVKRLFSENIKRWNFQFSIAVSYGKANIANGDCCDFFMVQESNCSHRSAFNSFIKFFNRFDHSKLATTSTKLTLFPINLESEKAMKLLRMTSAKEG